MKTKKEIAIKLTDKNRKKVQGILEMFGERTYSDTSIDDCIRDSMNVLIFENKVNSFMSDIHQFNGKRTLIKPKELRSILAAEKLKEGDYVIVKDFLGFDFTIKISGIDGDEILTTSMPVCFNFDTFQRYATQEEIDLLEGKEVDKFAELKEAHKNGAVIEVEYRKPYSDNVTWNESNEDVLWNPSLNHRIKPEDKPKVGDVVAVWNNNSLAKHIIGTLEDIHLSKHYGVGGHWYDNATKLTQQEVIELLFK